MLAAVALAALLRGPLTFAGLPYVHHSDEPANIRVAERMAAERDANPRYFTYPALMVDVEALVLAPFVDAGSSRPDDAVVLTQTLGNSRAARPGLVVALRWAVGVLPGLVAVGAAGGVAWLASRRWWAAGLSAGLAALSPLDLTFGPQVTPNALAGAASALAVLGAVGVAVAPRPTRDRYLLAGAAVGAAAAAKYNAALSGVALAVAHVSSVGRDLRRQWWMPVLAALAGLATFLVLNPFALVEGRAFLEGIRFESRHYRRGHPGSDGGSLVFHLSELWGAFGPALLLVPLAPLARAATQRRAALAVLGFVVVYVGFASSFEVRFARNLLPVTAPLAAASALGAVVLVDRLADRSAGRRSPVAWAAVVTFGLAAVAWPAVEAGRGLSAGVDDPWAGARSWMAEHVEPGSRVAVEPYGVYVDPERYRVTTLATLTRRDVGWYQDHGFALLVAGEANFGRFLDEPERFREQADDYRALFARTCTRFADGPDGGRVLLIEPRACE